MSQTNKKLLTFRTVQHVYRDMGYSSTDISRRFFGQLEHLQINLILPPFLFEMFGGGSSSSGGGMFGGGGGSSTTESILPTFQDEPACAQCCPQLTFKQR
jgi:hypothetical protein